MKRLGNVGSSSKNACRGQGMSVLCLCAVAAAMGFGCNDSGNSNNDPTVTPGSGDQIVFSTYVEHDPVERSFDMESKAGCALDSDCADGRFCYHGVCTYQCNEYVPISAMNRRLVRKARAAKAGAALSKTKRAFATTRMTPTPMLFSTFREPSCS